MFEEKLTQTTKYGVDGLTRVLKDHFVCATYDYDKESQNKNGGLTYFSYNDNRGLHVISSIEFSHGILAVESIPTSDPNFCFLASSFSNGGLKLFGVTNNSLEEYTDFSFSVTEFDTPCALSTSIQRCTSSRLHNILISCGHECGLISTYCYVDGGLRTLKSWKGHEDNVWDVEFDNTQENILFSCSDDSSFKVWDLRLNGTVHLKKFNTGVCCIKLNPIDDKLFAIGGFDEYLIIYDKRFLNSEMIKIKIDGPLWKINWHNKQSRIMISGMQSGYHVVNFREDFNDYNIYTYGGRNRDMMLGYSGEWLNAKNKTNDELAITSFYEKELIILDLNLSE